MAIRKNKNAKVSGSSKKKDSKRLSNSLKKDFIKINKSAAELKKQNVSSLESEVLSNPEISDLAETAETDVSDIKVEAVVSRDMLEQIMFTLPFVKDPIIGTPQQVQKELDALVKKMQKRPGNDTTFNKIHLYMHGYLINVVLKKFPFIRGLQTVDVYQETLIALRFKAIPGFKNNKGMSFLNFAKMCIRRHLITLLNASKNRKKDQSINQAISLDSSPIRDDDESSGTYANIIPDKKAPADKAIEVSEAYEVTKKTLFGSLSEFEQIVLNEYLSSSSYREISRNINKITKSRYNTKSIDNALLRIRKKAMQLLKCSKKEDLPIFIPKSN